MLRVGVLSTGFGNGKGGVQSGGELASHIRRPLLIHRVCSLVKLSLQFHVLLDLLGDVLILLHLFHHALRGGGHNACCEKETCTLRFKNKSIVASPCTLR
eukprot:NODE_3129_length_451_cov_51.212963_g3079_i0.p1 GENE.NODE_3129_length_451_cov_51.212963_g3079_i0~~NODE_3129_length_451_cov_51.212963_g3079_i0.p1  ORF type:complete len:100 (+),score=2.19 NODE_3129_length_451_cov_51.212963_g3079_i0:149-448(+)